MPRLPRATDHRHGDEFDVEEGDEPTFTTTWVPSYDDDPVLTDPGSGIEATIADDRSRAGRGRVDGVPHPELVRRSLLTLRSRRSGTEAAAGPRS